MWGVYAALLVLTSLAAEAAQTGTYSRRQLECFASKKVLHEGRCYALLEQGPCAADSRLTLDEAALPEVSVVCSSCRCCDVPRAVWWPGTASCRRTREEEELCGGPSTGTYLGEDLFGDGACLCRPGHARRGDSGACHALYHRGPCPKDHVFVVSEEDDEPRCERDTCARDNSAPGRNSTSAKASDGSCYALGSRGPCPDDSTFNVHPETLRPQCIDRTNHIIQLPCRSNLADVNGGCTDVVQPQDDSSFGLALIKAAKKRSTRMATRRRRPESSPR